MTTHQRAFISHVSEESAVALALKEDLKGDFLGLLDIFVSSDIDSIAAGDNWVDSVEKALRQSAVLLMLCSPVSIRRPWINFEAGAAWVLGVPIVPICHADLTPHDLPMPLSLRQGISIGDASGLRRLYGRLSEILMSEVPRTNFEDMARRLSTVPVPADADRSREMRALEDDRGIWRRLHQALSHPDHTWRSLEWAATEAGVSQEVAADLLRANDQVRFSRGRGGAMIVGLKSRVGER